MALTSSWLTGSLPTEIGNLSRLTSLTIAGPYATIASLTFPSEIALLSNMKHFHLEALSSPDALWLKDAALAMTALTSLTFILQPEGAGSVSMKVPTEIGSLRALKFLDLGNSLMSGTLPVALTQLTTLTHLDLSVNTLSGTIPTELGLLTNLNFLAMFANTLTGFVPSEIGELSFLGMADFAGNPLSPPVPPEACTLGRKVKITWQLLDFTSDRDVAVDGCQSE